MLDILVPEIVLDRPCVVAVIRQLEPAGMAQHVRMHRKPKSRELAAARLQGASLQGADLREAKGVTASQIKQADNWELAFYYDHLLKELGLPADHNETVEKKLAEMEKEKTATKP